MKRILGAKKQIEKSTWEELPTLARFCHVVDKQ
jgi:hypothetical protein